MKVMALFSFKVAGLFLHLPCSRVSARDRSQLYRPWARAILHLDSNCASVSFWPQSLQFGSSLCPDVCRCNGVGRVLWEERNTVGFQSLQLCPWGFVLEQITFCPCTLGPLFHCPLPSAFTYQEPVLQLVPCFACSLHLRYSTAGSVHSQVLSAPCRGFPGCHITLEHSLPALRLI